MLERFSWFYFFYSILQYILLGCSRIISDDTYHSHMTINMSYAQGLILIMTCCNNRLFTEYFSGINATGRCSHYEKGTDSPAFCPTAHSTSRTKERLISSSCCCFAICHIVIHPWVYRAFCQNTVRFLMVSVHTVTYWDDIAGNITWVSFTGCIFKSNLTDLTLFFWKR